MNVVIDCSSTDGPVEWIAPLTEAEQAHVDAVQAESARRAEAERAAELKRSAALEALKGKAKLSPEVKLLADALGLEI